MEHTNHEIGMLELKSAKFSSLTQIEAITNNDLSGIKADNILITLANGRAVDTKNILKVSFYNNVLTVNIAASVFARITSEGTTIAVRTLNSDKLSKAVMVEKAGEPSANGHILGSSIFTDEGWSTGKTDPEFYNIHTGQKGLWRFADTTPDRDINGMPISWNNGNIHVPAQKAANMLVLFVEFSDRLAENADDFEGVSYKSMQPYIDFVEGASKWFYLSSYGHLKLNFVSPQIENNMGWIMMDKNAKDYPWCGKTHEMFDYIREACQHAYDNMGIKADEYDLMLIMPPRLGAGINPMHAGLFNGPANINGDPCDIEKPNAQNAVYYDRDGKPHCIGTCITAGNDMFWWGYRWVIHETGHTFGFPDTYTYNPSIEGKNVSQFFWCGDWDMMGNIAGHSTDFFAWHKWKLRWIRDDQVDVITKSGKTVHHISPVETPGGSKMVVIRTGISTTYVVEFRTKLGINGLDNRGKHQGVLIYRLDASKAEQKDKNYCMQVISKKYYNSPEVGGSKNLNGIYRPIDVTVDGYNTSECCWQPGDIFEDPACGLKIQVSGITNCLESNPDLSPYTEDDTASIIVTKETDSVLEYPIVLSNAKMHGLSRLTFDTNVELQKRFSLPDDSFYIREESSLAANDLTLTKADESIIMPDNIECITINPENVEVTFKNGTFKNENDYADLTVATKPFFYFAGSSAVELNTPPSMVIKNFMTQPVYDASKSICETVFIEVPCDTDCDGKRDLVEVAIRRPLETSKGMKVPVIYEINPYFNKVAQSPNHDVYIDQDINPSTANKTYDDVRYKGMNAADWDPDAAGAPKARVSNGTSKQGTLRDSFNTSWYTYFISRGYAVAISGTLGNLNSEGVEICGKVEDTLVAKTLIEWLNGRAKAYTNRTDNIEVIPEWCNGNVAMSGVSYPASLPIAAACTGVEGLKTIIPVCGICSWYDSYRYGGAVIAPDGNQGEDVDSVAEFAFSRALNEDNYPSNVQAVWKKNIKEMNESFDRKTGDYNAFWDERNYLTNADKIKASVFIVAGLNDWNVKPKNFDQLWRVCERYNVPHKMILSQGPHFPVYNLAGLDFMVKIHKWLDHFLYDIDNDWDSIPNVIIQSNKDLIWENHNSWPIKNACTKKLYLAAGEAGKAGCLSDMPITDEQIFKDTYLQNQAKTVSNENIAKWTDTIVGANDPKAIVPDRVLYMSSVLTDELRLCGTAKVTLNISTDKGKGTLSAMLVDYGRDARVSFNDSPYTEVVAKNGIEYGIGGGYADIIKFKVSSQTDYKVVTRGWVDVQNPNPSGKIYIDAADTNYIPEYYYQTELIEPGKDYSYTFCMEPMDYSFKEGHRIGIIIYSSDAQYSIIPNEPAAFKIKLGKGTFVQIPIC